MLGGIVAFETNPNYSYACGDATKAYSPHKMGLFTRQMVYLPPDSFVIFDRVTSTKPEFAKRWLLHAVEQPVLAGKVAAVSAGDGRLFSQTLLPEDARFELVGGPGKEFWVDGKNYPPPQPDRAEEAGAWRIEVSPGAPRTEDYFLHLLTATASDTTKAPVAALLKEEGAVGLEFSPAGKSCRVTFATQGKPAGHITIKDASGLVLLDQALTQDVQPQRFMPEEEAKQK
jgi:heparin/heparan-sulfate lyase